MAKLDLLGKLSARIAEVQDLKRQRDDLVKELQEIASLGKRQPGYGYSCAMLAEAALKKVGLS